MIGLAKFVPPIAKFMLSLSYCRSLRIHYYLSATPPVDTLRTDGDWAEPSHATFSRHDAGGDSIKRVSCKVRAKKIRLLFGHWLVVIGIRTANRKPQSMISSKLRTLVIAAWLGLSWLQAENWSNWRGPEYNGSSPERNLPEKWSKEENIRWATDMPGPSAATPAIYNDRVFVSALHARTKDLLALGLDRKTGKILWQEIVGSGFGGDEKSSKSSPSPIADEQRVYFYFGSGDLAAFDHGGKLLWSRNIQYDYGDFAFYWTYSSSPLLYGGNLYLQVMQRDVRPRGGDGKEIPSFLLALDPASGKTKWIHVRPSLARAESREAFSTPIPFEHQGRKEILLVGGDCITGHDPQSGVELWRWGTWNPKRVTHWRLVPSPAPGGGVVLACAPKKGSVYAIKLGGEGKLVDDWIAWESSPREVTSDVCTPLYYQGRFYILDGDGKTISCVKPKTGEVVWTGKLDSGSIFRASPTAGDGKIYCFNHEAQVFVLAAGAEFKVLSQIDMGDGDRRTRASVAISHGDLFIRTQGKLFCVSGRDRLAALDR